MAVLSGNAGRRRMNDSQKNKPCTKSLVRVCYVGVIVAAVVLSALAVSMARDLTRREAEAVAAAASSSSSSSRLLPRVNKAAAKASALPLSKQIAPASSGTTDRVYCMIPFIWNEDVYNTIMQTWGKRCDVINFLTDAIVGGSLKGDKITDDPLVGYKPYTEFPAGTFPDNVIFVNMTRPWNECFGEKKEQTQKKVCRHIWEKMWRSWVYVEEHHSDQAEWFCKVDYDTFFFPENVKYYVREQEHWDPLTEHHYFGHFLEHRIPGREGMIAGATACWSRKTLHAAAETYREMPKGSTKGERGLCEDRAQATEEVTTSKCLYQHHNITAEPARDPQLREYITLAKLKDQLTWNRTEQGEWWFWKGKPEGSGQGEDCCAVRPIGLHKYKDPKEIQQLDLHFYGEAGNKELKKLNARTLRYVTKVRNAMGIE